MKKKSKIRIFANPLLLFALVGVSLLNMLLLIICAIILNKNQGRGICIFLAVGNLVSMIMCFPRVLVVISFEQNKIKYCAAFKKPQTVPYDFYPYIYRAFYTNGFYKPIYIVISRRRLSKYDLEHINQISISNEILKIKYSKRHLKILQEILPPKKWHNLKQNFKYELEH